MSAAGSFGGLLPEVDGLEFGRRGMPNGLQQSMVVEPVDPLQGGVFDVLDPLPGAAPADQLGLVQPDDRLGQRVVVTVATGADRGDGPGLGEPLGVANSRYCLGSKGRRNTALLEQQ